MASRNKPCQLRPVRESRRERKGERLRPGSRNTPARYLVGKPGVVPSEEFTEKLAVLNRPSLRVWALLDVPRHIRQIPLLFGHPGTVAGLEEEVVEEFRPGFGIATDHERARRGANQGEQAVSREVHGRVVKESCKNQDRRIFYGHQLPGRRHHKSASGAEHAVDVHWAVVGVFGEEEEALSAVADPEGNLRKGETHCLGQFGPSAELRIQAGRNHQCWGRVHGCVLGRRPGRNTESHELFLGEARSGRAGTAGEGQARPPLPLRTWTFPRSWRPASRSGSTRHHLGKSFMVYATCRVYPWTLVELAPHGSRHQAQAAAHCQWLRLEYPLQCWLFLNWAAAQRSRPGADVQRTTPSFPP